MQVMRRTVKSGTHEQTGFYTQTFCFPASCYSSPHGRGKVKLLWTDPLLMESGAELQKHKGEVFVSVSRRLVTQTDVHDAL